MSMWICICHRVSACERRAPVFTHILREASTRLLVLLRWAMRRPQIAERAKVRLSRFFINRPTVSHGPYHKKMYISKQEFDIAAKSVVSHLSAVLPKMIGYKNYIQRSVLDIATPRELADVRDSRINQRMIDKLCKLAKNEWLSNGDAQSLYCAAMAVATIVKEYEWGSQYLIGDGLWEIAQRIQNA